MKKRQFKPKTKILHLEKDLNLGQDIKIEVWVDPSRDVVFDLLGIFGLHGSDKLENMPPADILAMNALYFECASAILIDCDIEDIDFSTPEATEKSFYDKRLPWGVFHDALFLYLARLTDEYSVLKKTLARAKELSNSGTGKKQQEES